MNNFALKSSRFATASSWIATTHSGTANTKGSWVTVIASTSKEANRLAVSAGFGTVFRDCLFDIGIGSAGNEVIVINNIPVSEFSDENPIWLDFPVSIPSGSRIAVRQQATNTSGSFRVVAHPYWGDVPRGTHGIYTYGADTSASRGTQIDPGGTGNVKGSWTQITSSTSVNHSMLWVAIAGAGVSRFTMKFQLDIGVGAASSESVLIPDLELYTYSVTDAFNPTYFGPFPVQIPAGTRLAGRALNDANASGTGRIIDVILFGA